MKEILEEVIRPKEWKSDRVLSKEETDKIERYLMKKHFDFDGLISEYNTKVEE